MYPCLHSGRRDVATPSLRCFPTRYITAASDSVQSTKSCQYMNEMDLSVCWSVYGGRVADPIVVRPCLSASK